MQADFAFNTAIAAVMELTNEIYRQRESAPPGDVRFAIATAGSLIFPFAPHLGRRGVRADDRPAGLGGAVAARPIPRSSSATRSSSWCR